VGGVDVHQHLWPEGFIDALVRRTSPPLLRGSLLEVGEGTFELDLGAHELDRRLAALDRCELDVAVVSLQPTLGLDPLAPAERDELVGIWEAGIRELAAASNGRIIPLAAGAETKGFAGASIAAPLLGDLGAASPFLDSLERSDAFLFVHPGPVRPSADAPEWWGGIVDYTAQMLAAYYAWLARGRSQWPDLRVVFALLAGGAPFQLERLAQRGVDVRSTLDENAFFDVATYGRRAIELCIETFGVHQLLYGSDTPVVDPDQTLQAVRGFGDSVQQIVISDNATRLLA
jgi:6-methylsalicylate decarboxylase